MCKLTQAKNLWFFVPAVCNTVLIFLNFCGLGYSLFPVLKVRRVCAKVWEAGAQASLMQIATVVAPRDG